MRSALPETLDPQLATLASRPPSAAGLWKYEIKFDGYRILARVENGRCKLFTRNRNDWTSKLQSLAKAVTRLDLKSAWLDCEAVVMGPAGVPSFNALQNAFDGKATGQIQLFVFDVPFLDGDDLRSRPLSERRRILKSVLSTSSDDRLRLSDEFDAPGASILETACAMGLEGVIAKRQDAPYVSGRTDTWLKLKCHQRQEFVIGGFTDRVNSSSQLGSLLLGVYDDAGALVSVGSVGTGFNERDSIAIAKKLSALETKTSPFAGGGAVRKGRWSKRAKGSERWVKPALVAEVRFVEWTPDAQIRHASFEGLRADKDPATIQRERPAGGSRAVLAPLPRASGIKVSHGDRVIDSTTGLTKLDLVLFYERIAPFILPHLSGRPVSLVRGPNGISGELFFQ